MGSVYPVEVDGPRLRLREFTVADAGWFHALVTHPQVMDSILDDRPPTLEVVVKLLEERSEAARRPDRTTYVLAVTSAGQLVGSCGLSNVNTAHRRAELGYAIHPDWQGKGYASEAATLIIQFGFRELGLHRIEATTAPYNTRSIRVLERVGMTHEGQARDHLLVRGTWRDSLQYAILATDTASPPG